MRPEHSRSALGTGIATDLNKATLFCNAPTLISSVPGFSLSDYQALSRCLYHRFGHLREGGDFENPLNLGQQAVQQPKVGFSR
jgi:hypothetical protein